MLLCILQCVFYNVKNRFQKVDIMIMKNKVIISIIPSIELQSVKLLLKGNFCSILIKCWIKSTPFLLKTGTFITLKNCIFMNDIELFSTLKTEICMQHLKTSRI